MLSKGEAMQYGGKHGIKFNVRKFSVSMFEGLFPVDFQLNVSLHDLQIIQNKAFCFKKTSSTIIEQTYNYEDCF